MRGASLASHIAARGWLERWLAAPGTDRRAAAAELFALVDALDSTPAVVRVLANPNRTAAAKATLVGAVLAGHDPAAVQFAQQVSGLRWSHDRDLADSLDELAVHAVLSDREAAGALAAFEDQVFAFERFLHANRSVRIALGEPESTPQARQALIESLLKGQIEALGRDLLARLAAHPRAHGLAARLWRLSEQCAELRRSLVATVTAASPISTAQATRLESLLTTAFGKAIQLNVSIDPAVVGGLRVRVGDEVVDATVLSRITEVRRALAS
jgi:F-type H+-transporting ATPase subunit delta